MKSLIHLASRFVGTPLMIHPPKFEVLVRSIGSRVGIDARFVVPLPEEETEPHAAAYNSHTDDREYAVRDGIAIIPVSGVLMKQGDAISAWSGASSYEGIQEQITDALSDSGVRGIMLDCDSPGGQTTGCLELSDFIYASRGQKPVWASINDRALSAAYGLASATSRIFITRMGTAGSVGVMALHEEDSEWEKTNGYKYTYIFAGKKKVDGNPHEPLSKGAYADFKAEIDREYAQFVATVSRNRATSVETIIATEAGLLWGENAIPLMADALGTFDDAMSALIAETEKVQGKSSTSRPRAVNEGISGDGASAAQAPGISGEVAAVVVLTAADVAAIPKGETMENPSPAAGTVQTPPAPVAGASPISAEATVKYCHACGVKLHSGAAKFCHACGAKVAQPENGDQQDDGAEGRSNVVNIGAANERAAAISALCFLAGCSDRAAGFINSKTSLDQVSTLLMGERAAASDRIGLDPRTSGTSGSLPGYQQIYAEAKAFVRSNPKSGISVARAVWNALEANPEIYAAFKAQHDVAPQIRALEKAGYKIARA